MGRRSDEFDRLYSDHHELVLAYFLRRLPDRQAAHDAAADVFLVVLRRLPDVPAGEEARLWIYGVCQRVLSNHRRASRRIHRLRAKLASVEPQPQSIDPETSAIGELSGVDVRRALGRLKESDQEILRLAAWEQLPHAEIGRLMGCSAHAVDQRIHRAIRRLKRCMEEMGYQDAGRLN